MKRQPLGRGLDALFAAEPDSSNIDAFYAPIERLHPARVQPRTSFDDATLGELADSIQSVGMLEPILVRRRTAGGYEIVAGERRWRAAQKAGLHEVPVIAREMSSGDAYQAALVENLQREDLNPTETARAFQRLIDEHGQTQESIAKLVGRDRSTVANSLRLLKLPLDVLDRIEQGDLSEGHGRALLTLAGRGALVSRLARQAIQKGWSVRETERQARAAARTPEPPAKSGSAKSANVRDLEDRLSRSLGARTVISDRRGRGHVKVSFSSYEELDRLLDRFMDQ
ncbi:MAG: ParB/RepB/Spo0J family partition protein [Proteobacteria bacterium]|nr:ParB/RepB/Spo0J family partition protein [Pseudomonadota bacterium]